MHVRSCLAYFDGSFVLGLIMHDKISMEIGSCVPLVCSPARVTLHSYSQWKPEPRIQRLAPRTTNEAAVFTQSDGRLARRYLCRFWKKTHAADDSNDAVLFGNNLNIRIILYETIRQR